MQIDTSAFTLRALEFKHMQIDTSALIVIVRALEFKHMQIDTSALIVRALEF